MHSAVCTTRLLIGVTLASCYVASMAAAAPQPKVVQPVSPQVGLDHEDTGRMDAPPLSEAGTTESFSYVRSGGNMYWITPTDGSQPYPVSESFLRTVLNNPNLSNAQQAELLPTYPALMQEMFTRTMDQWYPDRTVEYEAPFSTRLLKGADGTVVLLEQDPLAAPYIRVRLISGGGKSVEFSVARAMVEQMLANEKLTDAQLLKGLQSFPFRLPETARAGNFARLSAAELSTLVQQDPEFQKNEFAQAEQRPAAVLPKESLRVRPRPAPAQPQPQPSVPRRIMDGLSLQTDETLKRASAAKAEPANALGMRMSVWRLCLEILSASLAAAGIILLLVCLRARSSRPRTPNLG